MSEGRAQPRLVIAGGGTGGHLFPGIAIAEAFCECVPGGEVLFVGTPRGLEARVVPARGFALELLEVGALKGLSLAKKLMTLAGLPLALVRAAKILLRFRPDVVVGVGGYVSGPVLLAARLLGKKTAIQEQNSVPGLTNRILGRIVHRVFTAFEAASAFFPAKKIRLLGNPIRKEIRDAAACDAALPGTPSVLVLGGSQGARRLNEILPQSYALLAARGAAPKWLHQSGEAGLEAARKSYQTAAGSPRVEAFIDDMAGALREASLVVGRAGASTLAEVCALGRPAVYVPFPFATDNHQEKNARELEAAGAAAVILEKDLTAEGLADTIASLIGDRARLEQMARAAKGRGRPDAAREIAQECIALADRR